MQFYSIIVSSLLFVSLQSTAQVNSPYARFGIGDLPSNENAINAAMGGVSIADNSPTTIQYLNPATYASLRMTTIQFALNGVSNKVSSTTTAVPTGGVSIAYLNLGLPISKHSGVSFGLMPFSKAYYNMKGTSTVNAVDTFTAYNLFTGKGGFQNFYVGYAYQYKGFSLGMNASYTFGNMTKFVQNAFDDTLNILNFEKQTTLNAKGINVQFGALYNYKIAESKNFKIGATYSPAYKLTTTQNTSYDNFTTLANGTVVHDTAYAVNNIKGNMQMPSKYSIGAMLATTDYWKVGIDYNHASWTNYTSTVDNVTSKDSTTNSWNVKVGTAYTPNSADVLNYWKRVEYRMGAYVAKDYIQLNNTNIMNKALTFGLGLPFRRSNNSMGSFNIAAQIGKRGTTKNGLISETYSHFTFGITLNDKWFLKRRYD